MTISYYEKMGDKVENISDEIPFELPDGWMWCRGRSCFSGMESTKPQGEFFDYIDILKSDDYDDERPWLPEARRRDDDPQPLLLQAGGCGLPVLPALPPPILSSPHLSVYRGAVEVRRD